MFCSANVSRYMVVQEDIVCIHAYVSLEDVALLQSKCARGLLKIQSMTYLPSTP